MANSYSGSDIKVGVLFEGLRVEGDPFISDMPLQTLTVNSMRSVSAVRTLGTSFPTAFTRGPRTVAGSMVCTLMDEDVFLQAYRLLNNLASTDHEVPTDKQAFVDQIPPFHIIAQGLSEYVPTYAIHSDQWGGDDNRVEGTPWDAQQRSIIILGCHLVNFGTGFSIDDILTESTYTYQAQEVLPWSKDPWGILRNWRMDTYGGYRMSRL